MRQIKSHWLASSPQYKFLQDWPPLGLSCINRILSGSETTTSNAPCSSLAPIQRAKRFIIGENKIQIIFRQPNLKKIAAISYERKRGVVPQGVTAPLGAISASDEPISNPSLWASRLPIAI